MKHLLSLFTLLTFCNIVISQDVTGSQLLDKAIAYHDPNNQWPTFNGTFNVVMEMPDNPNRESKIHISIPSEYFHVSVTQSDVSYALMVNKGKCPVSNMNAGAIKELGILTREESCEKAKRYKNYYTYLYGLPMKLKDPGTNIDPKVELKTFKGKDYLVLKVTYDETVGSDVWYFYFNPKTYAMEIYQFFKTDDNGKVKPDSGEYILLTEEATINTIKMPKTRAWYYNKDDKYLGTDTLTTE